MTQQATTPTCIMTPRVNDFTFFFFDFHHFVIKMIHNKAKYVSRYVPGSYAAGSSSDQQHYWELLEPTLLDDLTDKDLDRLLKKVY